MEAKRERRLLLGLVCVCFCMRSPMSPVGPLTPQIQQSLGLSAALAGLMTTIPLLIFALVSPSAGGLLRRADDRRLTPACLLLLIGGLLLRSYAGLAGLLAGTVLLGLGVGVLNVSIPVFIRSNFPARIGLSMGVYTMAMTLMSALSAGFCVPLSAALGGWRNALAFFIVFPALAIPVWLLCSRRGVSRERQAERVSLSQTARSWKSWCIALFMALQSGLFFCMIAWLPSALLASGARAESAGLLVLMMQLVSLITNFLMPVLLQRFPGKRRRLAMLCGLVYMLGFLPFVFGPLPVWLRVASVVLLGLGSGLSLSFALTMIALSGCSRAQTAGLSAFAQGAGYLLAAPMPVVLGLLLDNTDGFRLPMLILALLCIPMACAGARAAHDSSSFIKN